VLTRRQLLISAAVLGTPVAALALPDKPGVLRLGILQSRQPFVDSNDIEGSRERAFAAYRVLVRRSLAEHGRLDWLAGGAFPLSGPGPFPQALLERLALTEHSAEVQWLKSLAQTHRLRLTLGGWWRDTTGGIEKRLLSFDSRGQCRALPTCGREVLERLQLHMPAQHGMPSLSGFAAECARQRRYGAWIEMLQGPELPPGVRPPLLRGSAVVAPDGGLLAHAGLQAESCLVAEVC